MPSEHRLHPYSIVFAFLNQIRLFVVPGILLLFGVGSRRDDWWEPWMMVFIVPSALVALLRYATYRYRHEGTELVIRSGLFFRRERHIPYARVQNIDAVQNVLHRLLNVVEVKIETGGGDAAEATMSVLPLSALRELRERVFADRSSASPAPATDPGTPAEAAPGGRTLLALDTRELLLTGFIENRGAVIIAAGMGVVWELGLFDRLMSPFSDQPMGRGAIRGAIRGLFSSASVTWDRVALTLAALLALLLFIRLLSMGWALVRLHGFRLTLLNGDARSEFGLLTRVATTIPLRRIQSLTVREGVMHRVFGRVAVAVDTAGGHADQQGGQNVREALAPLLRRAALADFVRTVVGTEIDGVEWHPPAPGAFRREVKRWLFTGALITAPVYAWIGWSAFATVPLVVAWAALGARQTIRYMGWAETGDAVLLKRGWLLRRTTVVPFARIQVVTRYESPFDRRTRMARVHVDSAGASAGSVLAIRYMPGGAAAALHARLAAAAAETHFRW